VLLAAVKPQTSKMAFKSLLSLVSIVAVAYAAPQTPPATDAIPGALDDDETNLSDEDGQNSDEVCFPSFSLTHPFDLCMF